MVLVKGAGSDWLFYISYEKYYTLPRMLSIRGMNN